MTDNSEIKKKKNEIIAEIREKCKKLLLLERILKSEDPNDYDYTKQTCLTVEIKYTSPDYYMQSFSENFNIKIGEDISIIHILNKEEE